MRIISGSHKSRHIKPPKNLPVRPTTDLAKEALFNILANNFDFDDIMVLDLFAGTGSITYEFASRGALGVTSIDIELRCVDFIRTTAKELDFDAVLAFRSDAFRFLQNSQNKYDIIFCDPPYDMEGIEILPQIVLEKKLLKEDGWLIIEHSDRRKFDDRPGFMQHRRYGSVNFSIFTDTQEAK
ncbi:MAG: RsmD family RNA methyltransferase [Chloroflexota bacterium]|nr:RsmD family RNA methyltransferase [Lentimicrobium sp.]